ncbi:hypothetical protein A20C1_00295 [marine actinobacterium PHSC20C1]|nr:hypothetical protein A20C1_00295 [marine actinobacterium PHSC20C1]
MTETKLNLYITKLIAEAPPLDVNQIGTLTSIFATQPPLRSTAA